MSNNEIPALTTLSKLASKTSALTSPLTVSSVDWDRLMPSYEMNNQTFRSNGDYVTIGSKAITSNINNDKNALVMLEAMKNLLIKGNCFTEDEFDKEYSDIKQYLEDVAVAKAVADKLTETTKIPTSHQMYEPLVTGNAFLKYGIGLIDNSAVITTTI